MPLLTPETRIGTILKANPAALESIISLSSHFNKLRNPTLRQLLANRASIAMASTIGGCTVADFFRVLEPLGFAITDNHTDMNTNNATTTEQKAPEWWHLISPDRWVELDVRPVLSGGEDPLKLIQATVKQLHEGQGLKLIAPFQPLPLMQLLGKQGYKSYSQRISEEEVVTWFCKTEATAMHPPVPSAKACNWDAIEQQFASRFIYIDVRDLPMPQPMMRILQALDKLPEGFALWVQHKRIPVYLLPELAARNAGYAVREKTDGGVELLIYKMA